MLLLNAYTTGSGSVTFNIEKRSTIGQTGTNLLSSDAVATTSGVEVSTFASNTISTGQWLWLKIVSYTGTPEHLVVCLRTSVS